MKTPSTCSQGRSGGDPKCGWIVCLPVPKYPTTFAHQQNTEKYYKRVKQKYWNVYIKVVNHTLK